MTLSDSNWLWTKPRMVKAWLSLLSLYCRCYLVSFLFQIKAPWFSWIRFRCNLFFFFSRIQTALLRNKYYSTQQRRSFTIQIFVHQPKAPAGISPLIDKHFYYYDINDTLPKYAVYYVIRLYDSYYTVTVVVVSKSTLSSVHKAIKIEQT